MIGEEQWRWCMVSGSWQPGNNVLSPCLECDELSVVYWMTKIVQYYS